MLKRDFLVNKYDHSTITVTLDRQLCLESVFMTRSSYEIENELHLHTVRNACQNMACCMECMLKDGMLYGMHAERRNVV